MRKDTDLQKEYGLNQKTSKQSNLISINGEPLDAGINNNRDALSDQDYYTGELKRRNLVELFLDA